MDISQKLLKEHLSYNQDTGHFFRIRKLGRLANLSKPAGYINNYGYVVIKIKGRLFKAHRLAILYIFGDAPKGEVDHINGIKSDNRLINLRDISKNLNQQNQRNPRVDNKCGFLGVNFDKRLGKFRSQITLNGNKNYLGMFDCAEDAHAAYIKAKREMHESCTI